MSEPTGHGSWQLRADPPSLLEGVASIAYRTALFGIALAQPLIARIQRLGCIR